MFQCDGDNHQNNLLIFWFIWNDYCLYGHGILRQKNFEGASKFSTFLFLNALLFTS